MTPFVLNQGEVKWDPQVAKNSMNEADAFDREAAEHICQMGNVLEYEYLLNDYAEECVIDVDVTYKYATALARPGAVDNFADGILELEASKLHLHKALPAKIDYDRLPKYFCYWTEGHSKT